MHHRHRQRRRRVAVVLACTAVLSGLVGTGATATAAPDTHTPVREALAAAVAAGNPGVVAAVDDANGRWEGADGVADPRTGRPADADGSVRVGSVSKTFTATVVLRLAEEGRFGLDDPVQRLLPGVLPYTQPITVRQLLRHTSGLPRYLAPEDTWVTLPELDRERFAHFTPAEVVASGTKQPLQFAPGTSWAYSNLGYTVLGMLVERVTGRPLGWELYRRVLAPAGLRHTHLTTGLSLLPYSGLRGYEQLYPRPRGLTDVTVADMSSYFGSGSVSSTAEDVNRFFRALLRGELLKPGSLAAMKDTVPTPNGGRYGLGLAAVDLGDCGTAWGHDGIVPGYGTLSLHTDDASTQVTAVGSRGVTASPEAANAVSRVAATALCGPRRARAATSSMTPLDVSAG